MTAPKKPVDLATQVLQLQGMVASRDARISYLESNLQDLSDRAAVQTRQLTAVDGILDEILTTILGVNNWANPRDFGTYETPGPLRVRDVERIIDRDERQENEISDLHSRIEVLQSRSTAAAAVCWFAKEHKG